MPAWEGLARGWPAGTGVPKLGVSSGFQVKGLHARTAGLSAALAGSRVGVINDPVLLAVKGVKGFEEAIVTGSEDAGPGILEEEGMVELLPRGGIE
jgi:hypothetical protein